jgi:hypothetical protein
MMFEKRWALRMVAALSTARHWGPVYERDTRPYYYYVGDDGRGETIEEESRLY